MVRIGSLLKKRLDLAYEMRCEGLEKITPHLIGPSGIGKSTFVYEWAREKAAELGLEFVDADLILPEEVERYLENPNRYFVYKDNRLMCMDPVDLSGQPRPVNSKFVAFLPLATARLLNACAGVLFLDEFMNETRQNMKAASYKLVRDFKMGDIALNPKTIVIAASNTAKYSSIVTSLPKPLRDRFDFIETEAPTIEDWAAWMDKTYGERWDREVLAYLLWRPSDFLANVEDTVEDDGWEPPATPRGWSYTALAFKKIKSKKITADEREEMLYSVAKGKLGRVGESLMAFLKNKVPSFEELVRNPEVMRSFKVEQKYLAALTVAEAINKSERNIVKAKVFLVYVAEVDDREFISAFFAFLTHQRRREVYASVKDNEKIVKCLELTGKALL